MKRFTHLGLMLLLSVSIAAQTPQLVLTRIQIAQDWLRMLCVTEDPATAFADPYSLRSAFEKWQTSDIDITSCSNIPSKKEIDFGDTSRFIPSLRDRALRMMQFRTEIQQTQDYVFGILEGSPTNTPSQFFANPDHGIFSYGGPVHFDELFISSVDRVALCKALPNFDKDARGKDPNKNEDKKDHSAHCNDPTYMTTGYAVDKIARLGSAITLDIRVAQVPLYQNGILIAADSRSRIKWSPTITGSFDTSKLYRSLAESSSLADYYNSKAPGDPSKTFSAESICGNEDVHQCVNTFAMGNHRERTALTLIPRINVSVTSPFDLAKYGSAFLQPPNKAGHSLYDVTFNWDLWNVVSSAKTRAESVKILTQVTKTNSTKPSDVQQIRYEREWRRKVMIYFVELSRDPEISEDEVWWREFRQVMFHEQLPGSLGGTSTLLAGEEVNRN